VFGIGGQVYFSSQMQATGTKADLVLNICRELKADIYLSGRGAVDYFRDEDYVKFANAGTQIIFQEFQHPIYKQFNSETFVPGLGCLDYLFNCGIAESGRMFSEK